jgi:hypothetical protein
LILQGEIMNSYFTCLQERIRLNMPVDEA